MYVNSKQTIYMIIFYTILCSQYITIWRVDIYRHWMSDTSVILLVNED